MTLAPVQQIDRDVSLLAELSAIPDGIERIAYSTEDVASRAWFERRCAELGLSCEIDRYGNCFGWSAAAATRPAVVLGSHLDSVRRAGRYDGVLGVTVAFAVVGAVLAEHPDAALGVAAFACEESTRFGLGAVGSRLLLGDLSDADLDRVVDLEGASLRSVLDGAGLADRALVDFQARTARYLEVHVDQGSIVTSSGVAIGIVPAIAGVIRTRLLFRGEASHSGAHRRAGRRDALLAAASFITAADTHWAEAEAAGAQLAVTVGHAVVRPNSSNTVPGEVELVLDVRSPDRALVASTTAALVAAAHAAATERRVELDAERLGEIPPVAMDQTIVQALCDGADALGERWSLTPSLAGHDASVIGPRTPAAMLFVANPTGLSHHPDEAIDPESLAATVRLLEHCLPALDGAR